MNRLIISGSPRAHGRSARLAEALRRAYEQAEPLAALTAASLATLHIAPCTGCEACSRKRVPNERYCVIADDMGKMDGLMKGCDELILVSPVYFSGAPSQLKAFLDRLQPYFYSRWLAAPKLVTPKRPAQLYVVGEGGDPHGFGPLVSEVRSALAVAGFTLETVHDWVQLISPSGALPEGADPLTGGRVHDAAAYRFVGPDGVHP